MRPLTDLRFEHTYARLSPAFYQVVEPTPLPDPYLVAFNPDAAELLDLDPPEGLLPEAALYLSGSRRIPGSEPIAMLYAGHQFGVWVPQLGDGRAFLLGEVRNNRGEKWDVHLKGGGQTRFSRFGDGRSVLRSTVREYLGSEAMHGLGIPTTRALCIVGSDLEVRREVVETAATLIRLSPSHVRFGTFQAFAARGEEERIRELAEYVIVQHFPDLAGAPDRYRRFFGEAVRSTARLVARWQAVGFVHGVLNTDNMSVLGLTLDYGPFGFLDHYDDGFVPNHSDDEGRYAFARQPGVGFWNLARLGNALLPLIPLEEAQAELDAYPGEFECSYGGLMRAKLGLTRQEADDAALTGELLGLLQAGRVDYTRFFRTLGDFGTGGGATNQPLRAMFPGHAGFDAWATRYAERLRREGSVDSARRQGMNRVNPKYILRGYLAQEAIERARARDFGEIERLWRLLRDPFAEQPEWEHYADPTPAWGEGLVISCSS